MSIWSNTILGAIGNLISSNQPSQPNLNTQTGQLAEAEANYLPQLLALQSEAELGTGGLIPGFTQSGDKYYQLKSGFTTKTDKDGNTIYLNKKGNQVTLAQAVNINKPVDKSQAVADFSGHSVADTQGQIQQQLAAGGLANAQEFDPQFIASALEQEKELNPQKVAAREALYNTIQQQIKNPPVSPVSNEMERQVGERLTAGSGLTPEEQAMLDKSVNALGASGITGTSGNTPNIGNTLTTGFGGEERALENARAGTRWMASGLSPEDIAKKASEQNIANLSAYYSGQTPESQFSSLGGAQSGPSPNTSVNPHLPQLPNNLAEVATGSAINQYGMDVNNSLNTVNPWAAGLSAALHLGGTAFGAGIL